jgi:hypothetical protein
MTYLGPVGAGVPARARRPRHGRFAVGSTQGVPGHQYVPWLAIQDQPRAARRRTHLGCVAGLVRLVADRGRQCDTGALTRIRAGRERLVGDPLARPGATLVTPPVAGAYSTEGLDGLARGLARARAGTGLGSDSSLVPAGALQLLGGHGFAVDAESQLALARIAADLGVGAVRGRRRLVHRPRRRHRRPRRLDARPGQVPERLRRVHRAVRALGLEFGLWVEPECVSPKSRLYAEHPDWVYRIDGRPLTLIRNQYPARPRPRPRSSSSSRPPGRAAARLPHRLPEVGHEPAADRARPARRRRRTWTAQHVRNYYRMLTTCAGPPARADRGVRRAAARGPTWPHRPAPTCCGPATTPARWTAWRSSTASCTPTPRT